MAQQIDVPGMGIVEFPDGMSDEQITSAIKANLAGQSAPVQTPTEQKPTFISEAKRVADQTLRGGVLAAPGFIGDAAVGIPSWIARKTGLVEDTPANTPGPGGFMLWPSDALQTITGGKVEKPQTKPGQVLGNLGEAITSAVAGPGGGTVKSGLMGLGAGLGGEGAAAIGGENPISRVIGALIGGGAVGGLPKVIPLNAKEVVQTSVKEMTPADWRHAKTVESTLQENGIPYLASQLLGPRSTLADIVRDASSNQFVRPKMLSATANIPQKSQQALELWKNSNLPIATDETRTVLGDVQKAASDHIDGLFGKANQIYASQLPPGVSASTYSPDQVRALADQLKSIAANPDKFGPLSAGGKFISGLADDLVGAIQKSKVVDAAGNATELPMEKGYVNNLLKDLNTRMQKEGYKGLSLEEVKGAIRDATPEFADARAAKSEFIRESINPVQKGLVGQLAQMGGGVKPDRFTARSTALDLVLPKDVPQPQAIKDMGKQLGGEAVGEILRENLSRAMEQATKLTAGPTGDQPFSFVKSVAGTTAQRQNLEAALQASAEGIGANPQEVRNGFYKLMKAFESTKDLKIAPGVDAASAQQQAGKNFGSLAIAPLSRAGRYFWDTVTAKTYKDIASMVASPDGLRQLEAIGKSRQTGVAQVLARNLMQQFAATPAQDK